MPIRKHDVFTDITKTFHNNCNAFVGKLVEAQNTQSLPVAMGPALQAFPGKWREKISDAQFQDTRRPLIVEIGCHTGHTLCDMAERHPECLFVGVDITFKRVVLAAERAKARGLHNVFVILANAKGLVELFSAGEIDGIVTFFPDPWKKKKHSHYRLYSEEFLKACQEKLSENGFLWLKTDDENYFQSACDLAKVQGYSAADAVPNFGTTDFSSFFMRRFTLRGVPYYSQKWLKSGASLN